MKTFIFILALMTTFISCAPDDKEIPIPTCFDDSSLSLKYQRLFRIGATYWNTQFIFDENCIHKVKFDIIPIPKKIGIAEYTTYWTITISSEYEWGECPIWGYTEDIVGVSAHEVGHTYGLYHSSLSTDIMHDPIPQCIIN